MWSMGLRWRFSRARLGSMVYSWRGGFRVYFQVHEAGKRSLLRIPCSTQGGSQMLDLLIIRGIFILVLTISAYALHPFHSSQWMAAAAGTIFGLCIIFFEMRLERVSLKRLIGAACGSVLGIVGAFIMSLVLAKASPEPFLQLCLLLLMT